MYVAVKGGEAAIANAHKLLADRRRGDRSAAVGAPSTRSSLNSGSPSIA
jgi:alpha-D-ribose 1-methylphosphonate 5-triphosphate synthase subunit PhnI